MWTHTEETPRKDTGKRRPGNRPRRDPSLMALEETNPARAWILNCQPPELGGNQGLLFKPLSRPAFTQFVSDTQKAQDRVLKSLQSWKRRSLRYFTDSIMRSWSKPESMRGILQWRKSQKNTKNTTQRIALMDIREGQDSLWIRSQEGDSGTQRLRRLVRWPGRERKWEELWKQ